MSGFYNIERTISKALEDLALGIDIREQNEEFDPPDSGQWAEVTMIPNPVESGMKFGTPAMDEHTGIMQVSLFDADTGSLSKTLLVLADQIAAGFRHGQIFTHFEEVFIQNTSRGTARMNGGFFQLDISIKFSSYVDR